MGATVSEVDPGLEARLRSHVERLAGEIGERNLFRPGSLDQAHGFLVSEWERQGYSVTLHAYSVHGMRCTNLEAIRLGAATPDRVLVVGAHYDSVLGSPGANDNATGVAALLELSRRFAALEPAMTVRFVAFVNEEPPFFESGEQGSLHYARGCRARGDDIRGMVSLETIGCYRDDRGSQHHPPLFGLFYPDRGNFIAFVSDFGSGGLMRRAAGAFRATCDFPLETVSTFRMVPGIGWSDHGSFWKVGYRAFMVTDTAFYRDDTYHTRRDTPDHVAFPRLARVVEGLCGAVWTLAADSGPRW